MARLLAIRQARLYLIGDAASNFGDYALFLAMAIWIKDLTGSTAAAGFAMFAFVAGNALLPVSGLLADRVMRRPLLIVANLLLAAVVLLLLLVHGRGGVWVIYVVLFLNGALGSVTGPAQQALLPAIVPADLIGDANGLLQSARGLLRLFSPVAGAGLFAWLGGSAVGIVDAATFVIAAVALLAIGAVEPARGIEKRDWRADIGGGLRFIRNASVLRQLMLACGLVMLVLGFFESIGIAVVTRGLGHTPAFLGVLGAAQAMGTIVGGLTAGLMVRRTGVGRTVIAGLGLVAASSLLLMSSAEVVVLIAVVILGGGVPWIITGATTALQRDTPAGVQGRVFAAFEFAVTVPQAISVAVGAALIATINYRVLLGVVAAVTVISLGYLAVHPTQRARPSALALKGASTCGR